MRSISWIQSVTRVGVIVALGWLSASALPAQQPLTTDEFAGNYKGTAKIGSGEMDVALEIQSAAGKVSGRAVTGAGEYQIVSGEIVGNKLVLKFGAGVDAATLTLEKKEDKFIGDWIRGAQKGTVEFRKIAANTADEVSGEWDATADAQGQPFPFTLTLKLEGEKVTGSSDSELGHANIASGVWRDGKLALVLDSSSGAIGLVATLDGGKLIGDYDFAGQLQGKWVAIRKK